FLHLSSYLVFSFFFFQAEDGIRDLTVTGVQTCALPISLVSCAGRVAECGAAFGTAAHRLPLECLTRARVLHRVGEHRDQLVLPRSEERRVGKECRSRWSRDH